MGVQQLAQGHFPPRWHRRPARPPALAQQHLEEASLAKLAELLVFLSSQELRRGAGAHPGEALAAGEGAPAPPTGPGRSLRPGSCPLPPPWKQSRGKAPEQRSPGHSLGLQGPTIGAAEALSPCCGWGSGWGQLVAAEAVGPHPGVPHASPALLDTGSPKAPLLHSGPCISVSPVALAFHLLTEGGP